LSKWQQAKSDVLATARRIEELGMVVGTSGNVSVRLRPEGGRELLAITPSSRYYDALGPEDIQVIDFDAEPVEGDLPPSSESMLHVGIYRARPGAGAVIHTHSVYASALAAAHLEIPPILDDQAAILGGEIKVAAYAPSGSDELVENALRALEDRSAVLLMNHGAVGVGRDLREAVAICQLIEKTAQAYYICLTLGKVNRLSDEAIAAGRSFYQLLHREVY
jgi:L-fuculose-phosphate aldolase